jgi:hypothetical protein
MVNACSRLAFPAENVTEVVATAIPLDDSLHNLTVSIFSVRREK